MNITQEKLGEILLCFLSLLIIAFILFIYPRKKCKSKIANEYGISKYTLSRWIELFCSQEIAQKYVGDRIQKIRLVDIQPILGYPSSFPKYRKKGEWTSIMNKSDLERAFDISRKKLSRIIDEIENPIDVIGMDIEIYKSLKRFPPSKIRKIYNYLLDMKCQGKKPKYQIARQNLDFFAETVDYVELADIK